jgi:hypothetical protein
LAAVFFDGELVDLLRLEVLFVRDLADLRGLLRGACVSNRVRRGVRIGDFSWVFLSQGVVYVLLDVVVTVEIRFEALRDLLAVLVEGRLPTVKVAIFFLPPAVFAVVLFI